MVRAGDVISRLEQRIGHRFARPELLERALTHRSAGPAHNERLEFLGDAVIGFLVAERLYGEQPEASEGKLTRLRARIVRRESLAAVARSIELGAALRLGGSALKSGGRRLDSVLADAFEALVGALYLDAGLAVTRRVLEPLLDEPLRRALAADGAKDAKTRLQEWLQARGEPLPRYRLVAASGSAHAPRFEVACLVERLAEPCPGEGSSLRRAEQRAARAALERLERGDD